MRRVFAVVLLCVFGLMAGASPAFAQATGAVTGQVTDESGAVLPGVSIELTNDATGQTRTAVTEGDGFYRIPLVQPGRYTVKGTLAGFRTAIRQGLTIEVNGTARADLQMSVGQVEESVTVTSEAPLVETANATMGIVIDQEKVVDLPLNGRNFTQLGTLIPGVVAPPAGLGGQAGDATPGGFGNATGGFNVNGMRNQSNSFLMDGASNNDTFNTGFVLRPPPDAIQEFKILTHSFGAEYGRNAGSVVNVVTRSGTNQFRGSLWEFNRDDSLQARNFFAPADQPKPVLQQNQFGAAFGGPIVKNTLFTFGYYEGFRNKAGNTQTLTVLTDAQRAGNFGSTTIRDPVTGLPFPNNTIPSDRISPVALKLMNDFIPKANVSANRYTVSPTVEDNRDQFGLRADHGWNDRNSVLARYMFSQTERATPRTVQPSDQLAKARLQDVMGSHTFIAKPNQINVIRASFNRIYANPAVTSGIKNTEYGIGFNNTNDLAVGLPSIVISGFPTLGDAQQPFVERVNNVLQITDDYTWLTGRHNLKFGFEFRREFMKIAFINRPNGDLTFNASMTGNGAADFLLGFASQARATTTQAIQEGTGIAWAGYVQDEFRVKSNITFNLGVRYELTQPFVDKNDAISGFSTGVQSTKFPAAPRRPDLPRRRRRAPRDHPDRQEQHRAAHRGGLGSEGRREHQRARRMGRVLRRAGRPGRLLPERRAVTAVHAAGRDQLVGRIIRPHHLRQAARQRLGRSESVPGQPDDHRVGTGLPDAVRLPLQPERPAPGAEPVRRRGRLRRVARLPHADLHGNQSRSGFAGPDDTGRAHDAGVRARAADLLRGAVVVRLPADQHPHAPDPRAQLPRVLHVQPRDRSRVGPEHRG